MNRRNREGVVYSTNPDFHYQYDEEPLVETLTPPQQRLRVTIERKGRGGKSATVINGYVGSESDLADLARTLKGRLGVGGAAKNGQIIIQGEMKEKVLTLLKDLGYADTR